MAVNPLPWKRGTGMVRERQRFRSALVATSCQALLLLSLVVPGAVGATGFIAGSPLARRRLLHIAVRRSRLVLVATDKAKRARGLQMEAKQRERQGGAKKAEKEQIPARTNKQQVEFWKNGGLIYVQNFLEDKEYRKLYDRSLALVPKMTSEKNSFAEGR